MEPQNNHLPAEITGVVDKIAELQKPYKIYLFSNKRGEKGKTSGFKLCVIAEHCERSEAERDIYLKVDSEVPFDIVLYTPAEWAELTVRKGSFAEKVAKTGALVYG